MQTIFRAFFTLGTLLAIGLALWFSLTLLGVFMLAGGGVVLFFAARQFLLDKGILNPRPGIPMQPPGDSDAHRNATVIETTFSHIDEKK